MEDLSETESLLRHHLKTSGLPREDAWTLAASPLSGRGVFATRDLQPGELVFVDAPLVLGPRTGPHCPPLCVDCHKSGVALVACSKGCGLPVCSRTCEATGNHLIECEYLLKWRPQQVGDDVTWSPDLLKTVAAVRCLGLEPKQRQLVRHLQTHTGSQHEREVEVLKKHLGEDAGLSEEDETFMRLCCRAMDANAFEVEVTIPLTDHNHNAVTSDPKNPSSRSSLRGLYPLSGMMNHACTPNTRHGYDRRQWMTVRAASFIRRGSEVTTSYSALLWGTPARRQHLAMTKHFLCACARCQDPQEGGSLLSALRCAKESCPGCLLPEDPLQTNTKWTCDVCHMRMPDKQARVIQATLGQMVQKMSSGDPQQTSSFLREQSFLPPLNQLIVEMKSSLVWNLGHRKGYHYTELSEEDLEMKIALCNDILHLLDLLQAGQCRMRGLLLYELYEALMEKHRRGSPGSQTKEGDALKIYEEVVKMFVDDVTSPIAQGHQLVNSH